MRNRGRDDAGRVAPDPALLDRLQAASAHRGPDGQGRLVRGGVALVHTRLAIIDLDTGDQPLFAPGGTALVANGEIYNNPELRAAMADAPFRTRSDCEPAVFLYERDGDGFADSLRGMYAIALHDPRRDRLVLARDPFGIKPLYYIQTDAAFVFASEPQALRAAGRTRDRSASGGPSCCKSNSPPVRTRSSPASAACCRARRWWSRAGASSPAAAAPPCRRARRVPVGRGGR